MLAGIFVGGGSTRMGGLAKGLLASPEGPSIVERSQRLLRELGHDVVLVGAHDAYAHLPFERVADEPPGIGPLGGLIALLRCGGETIDSRVLAVACDMPFVSRGLVERLGTWPADGPILAPRRNGRWEPLFARYDAGPVLPLALALAHAAGSRSLQRLLDRAGAVELPLSPREERELDDWDSPSDTLTE
jgi:molybdopterin-guanine dinucleotide biosynthesis protein A